MSKLRNSNYHSPHHHRVVTITENDTRVHFLPLSGRSNPERSAGAGGQDGEAVVTTEVCPRSRPEGRKLDSTLSLPPPRLHDKQR